MQFRIEKEIFQKHPDFNAGVVAARGIDNLTPDNEIEAFLRHASLEAALLLRLKPAEKDSLIQSYRKALAAYGAESRPSMEARLGELAEGLAQEAAQEKSFAPGQMTGLAGALALPRKNPAADLVRGAEIQFRIPVFAFDMGDETAPLTVRLSEAGDTWRAGGREAALPAGEPVFAMGKAAAVRHFFCEQGETAAVTGETRNLLIVLPCFTASRRRAMSVRNELARRVKDSFGRTAETAWLDSALPVYESHL